MVVKRRLGELPFDLGDVYLLAGGIHEEIDGVQHSELERQLLMFLDVVVGVRFCAFADLLAPPNRVPLARTSPIPSRRTILSSSQ